MFGFAITAAIFTLLAITAFTAAALLARIKVANALIAQTVPYSAPTTDYRKTLLVLGDSTGVGVGAEMPEYSVAGFMADYLHATYVENHAVSGAEVLDLSTQIQKLRLSHYDFILIQIGGNDVLAFHNAKKTAAQLSRMLDILPDATRVVVISAGNAGGGRMFPWIVRGLHTMGSLGIHKEFAKVVNARKGMRYVNLWDAPLSDPFILNPWRYLAADGLHPSSWGYRYWFEKLRADLEKNP